MKKYTYVSFFNIQILCWHVPFWADDNLEEIVRMWEKLPGSAEVDNLSFSARLWSLEKELVIFKNESCIFAISKNIWLVQRTTHIILMVLKEEKLHYKNIFFPYFPLIKNSSLS